MFPDHWTADRIKVEVDATYKNRIPHSDIDKRNNGMWEGTTPSGVHIEGFSEPNVTAYPVIDN